MTPTKQTILFDLDGTLVDTSRDIQAATNALCIAHNKPQLSLEQIKPLISGGSKDLITTALGVSPQMPAFAKLRHDLFCAYANLKNANSSLFSGIPELLDWLNNNGFKWGIVTNKPHDLAESLVENLNLQQQCSYLIGAKKTHANKPSPEPINIACKQLNIKPCNAIYIGDSITDIQAGKAAGTTTVAAEYGFIGNTKIESWGADKIIQHPSQLIDLIKP